MTYASDYIKRDGERERGEEEEERKKEEANVIIKERKVMGLSSSSLFPARKREVVTRVEPFEQRDRPTDAEENPGNRYRQNWEDKRDRGSIPDTFT